MATIEMKKVHTIGKEEARKRAEELAEKMREKIGIEWKWQGDAIQFEAKSGAAKGTKGHVAVTDKDIAIQVDLPFLLRPLKGMVEGKIREKLNTIK